MSKIIYRQIIKEDYETIKALINEAFGLYKFIDDESVLDKCLNIYLRSCLASQTFSSIAVKDGKVVGIILGSSKYKKNFIKSLSHNIILFLNSCSLIFKSKEERKPLIQYKKIFASYKDLIANREADFQGCIDLFIVGKECQGLGVGKKLVSNLFEYMKDSNVSNLYLYTDNICNYGFYDSQGFKRIDSRNIELTNHTTKNILSVYLYSYTFN